MVLMTKNIYYYFRHFLFFYFLLCFFLKKEKEKEDKSWKKKVDTLAFSLTVRLGERFKWG
jgi:hypothetical protein